MNDDLRQQRVDDELHRRAELREFARRHPEWAEFNAGAVATGWDPQAAAEMADIHMQMKERT